MVKDEFGKNLPAVPSDGQAEVTGTRAAIGSAASAAIEAAFDTAILELVNTRGCRNVHAGNFMPVVALGAIWGDPTTNVKSWMNTPLQPIYDHWAGQLPHDAAMNKAKLVAGCWLRLAMDTSPYLIRSYKADDEGARMYFISPDDPQPDGASADDLS